MVYALSKDYELAIFDKDLVLLDKCFDRFRIINNVSFCDIIRVFDSEQNSNCELTEALLQIGAIKPMKGSPPYKPSFCTGSKFFENRWTRPVANPIRTNFVDYLNAARCLLLCAIRIRTGTLDQILAYVPFEENKRKTELSPNDLCQNLIYVLNRVYWMDISANKCLTYSKVLQSLLRYHGLNACLIIGVRTRPFVSHAWVEIEGNIVNDDPDLRDKLAVIMG